MKTENNVMVPFDTISLRTKFKEKKKKNHEYQSLQTNSLTVPNIK